MKTLTVSVMAFLIGSCVTILALTNQTVEVHNRSCDDIIRHDSGKLVCEVSLQAEDDNIVVLEYK